MLKLLKIRKGDIMVVDWVAIIVSVFSLIISISGYLITNKYSLYPNRAEVRQRIVGLVNDYKNCNGYNALFGLDKTKDVFISDQESILRETRLYFGKRIHGLLTNAIEAGAEYRKTDSYFMEYNYILSLSDFDFDYLRKITLYDYDNEFTAKDKKDYYNSIEDYSIDDIATFSLAKYNLNDMLSESDSKNTAYLEREEILLKKINKKIISL